MKLIEFSKMMEKEYSAYWTSFSVQKKDEHGKIIYEPFGIRESKDEKYKYCIDQIDTIGVSRGVESRMIDILVWVKELPENPIAVTCKMLGSSLDECLNAIKNIVKMITPYF